MLKTSLPPCEGFHHGPATPGQALCVAEWVVWAPARNQGTAPSSQAAHLLIALEELGENQTCQDSGQAAPGPIPTRHDHSVCGDGIFFRCLETLLISNDSCYFLLHSYHAPDNALSTVFTSSNPYYQPMRHPIDRWGSRGHRGEGTRPRPCGK